MKIISFPPSIVHQIPNLQLAFYSIESILQNRTFTQPFSDDTYSVGRWCPCLTLSIVRPESELVLPDGCPEDDVQATPRQLERLLEESNSGSSVSSTSPDSGLQLEDVQEVYVREQGMAEAEDTVMESRSLLRSTEDHVRSDFCEGMLNIHLICKVHQIHPLG